MKGFSFISYLTYPLHSNEQEIQNYINFDGFPDHQLNTQNRFIIYTIDNSQCISLSDLLEFQKMKFIKLTRAQLLQICLDLISKFEEMQRMNFKHNYIQTDSIWLKMKQINKNQIKIKIKRRKIFYSIHILGYQSPFYEQIDYQPQNDELSIKQIIKDILNLIKEMWENKKKKKQYKIHILRNYYMNSLNFHWINLNFKFMNYLNHVTMTKMEINIQMELKKNQIRLLTIKTLREIEDLSMLQRIFKNYKKNIIRNKISILINYNSTKHYLKQLKNFDLQHFMNIKNLQIIFNKIKQSNKQKKMKMI